ncbi:MAG TPA: helix-turn-helix domain-containing protein [Pseudonocardiaceae bacterium]
MTEIDRIPPKTNLRGDQRIEIREQFKAAYERGATVKELAEATGRSYGSVHKLLVEAGTTFRGRGGAGHRKRRNSSK